MSAEIIDLYPDANGTYRPAEPEAPTPRWTLARIYEIALGALMAGAVLHGLINAAADLMR